MSARALHLSFAAALTALLLAAPAACASTKPVRFAVNSDTPESTFFQAGGLKLRGSCLGGSLQVLVGSVTDHSSFHASSIDGAGGGSTHYAEDDDLNRNEFDGLLATLGADDATGQLAYSATDGTNVTVNWLAEEGDAFGGTTDCAFVGTARVAKKGAADDVLYQAGSNSPPRSFFKGGGLRLRGSCEGGDLSLTARSAQNHSTIHADSIDLSGGGTPAYTEEDGFDADENVHPLDHLAADDATGQFSYARRDGTNVTVTYLAEEGDAYGATRACVFAGTASVAQPGSPGNVGFAGNAKPLPHNFKTFFKGGGLKVQRRCTEPAKLDIALRSLSDHATVHYGSLQFSVPGYGEDDDFSTGSALTSPLLEGDSGIGQIVSSRQSGAVVTVNWLSEEGDAYGGTRDCAFLGTADVG
jgi:hypothetical protein